MNTDAAGSVYEVSEAKDGVAGLAALKKGGYPLADVESDPTFERLRKDPRYAKVTAAAAGRH
jgi:hypothetical protein